MKKCDPIIVVGPGRCGTSVVAGLLHTAGVNVGDKLFSDYKFNPKGHFEDIDFLYAHKNFSNYGYDGLRKIIKKKQDKGVRWGLKDPRIAYHLLFYLGEFENPKVIRCRRNMRDIKISINKTFGKKEEDISEEELKKKSAFDDREELIEKYLEGYDYLDIWFENIVEGNTEYEIGRIMGYCNIETDEEGVKELLDFVIRREQK